MANNAKGASRAKLRQGQRPSTHQAPKPSTIGRMIVDDLLAIAKAPQNTAKPYFQLAVRSLAARARKNSR